MATGTGLDRQIGYAIESTYGTGVTVTRFIPAISETLAMEITTVESEGQIAGAQMLRSSQWTQGNKHVGGDIGHELMGEDMGILFRAALGTVNTSGTAAPYTHEFWPASANVSFTTQVGRPTTYGSVIPFTYTGCKVQSWELSCQADEIVTWGMTVIAQDEQTGTALASASYSTTARPWNARSGAVTIDGTAVPVRSMTVSGDMGLSDNRWYVGSTLLGEPLRVANMAITGQLEVEWGNLGTAASTYGTALYQKYVSGTEGTLQQVFTSGTTTATITANIRFDGQTPNSSDKGIVMHTVPFKAMTPGTLDSAGFKVTMKNSNATA